MIKTDSLPKWATLDRRAYLVKLWTEYGNKCLYGHKTCPIPSHYVYVEPKDGKVAIPIKILCRDREGNLLKIDGKQVYLTLYVPKTVTTQVPKIARLYELKSELAIKDWKHLDREQSQAEWEAERKALHNLGEQHYPILGRFNAISKDIFANNQPLYYLEGQAVSGLTLKPFVKVRIASSYVRLFIDLGEALRQVSKSKRRKAIRYGKPLPQETQVIIRRKVLEAVRDYLAH